MPFRSGKPYAVLGGAQIAVGAAAIFARFALSGAAPLAVAASRLCIASALLLAVAAVAGAGPSPSRVERRIFAVAGIVLGIHFATWIWSLEYTSVAVSTLLVATTPIWTALYDSLTGRRRLSALGWLAFAPATAGLVLIVDFSRTPAPIRGHELAGDLLALAGAAAIGAYFILVREVRSGYGTRAIVTRTYSWAALALLLAAAAAAQPPAPFADGVAWGGIVAMALISQLLGHTAMNASLRWFSPSAVAFTTLIEPIVAAVLAWIVFGERLGATTFAGGALVLAAIALFVREERALIPRA